MKLDDMYPDLTPAELAKVAPTDADPENARLISFCIKKFPFEIEKIKIHNDAILTPVEMTNKLIKEFGRG